MGDEDQAQVAEDAISLGIGRVARTHVRLDYALREVHRTLVLPGLGIFLQGGLGTDRLVEDCKLMIKAARLDDTELTAAASEALGAAKEANQVRNRVVHDMWMRELDHPPDVPRWTQFRAVRGELGLQGEFTKDMGYIEAAQTQLLRATVRIHALNWGLHGVLPFFQGSGLHATNQMGKWVTVMRDQFTLNADGSYTPQSTE